MDLNLHSYSFRAYSLAEAFQAALRYGWTGLELHSSHFERATLGTDLPAAIALGNHYGVPVNVLDFEGDFIREDAVEGSVKTLERDIDLCVEHGVPMLNGFTGWLVGDDVMKFGDNGSALAEDSHYGRVAEAFRHLGAYAGKRGVLLTIEIHMNTVHDSIASAAKLLDRIGSDHVLANPDPCNMFSTHTAERDPDALDALAGRIGYFHLKNCAQCGDAYDFSYPLESGHMDVYKWLRKVLGMGYRGPICVEYCGEGDPRPSVKRDNFYLRDCLSAILAGG